MVLLPHYYGNPSVKPMSAAFFHAKSTCALAGRLLRDTIHLSSILCAVECLCDINVIHRKPLKLQRVHLTVVLGAEMF